MHHELYPEPVPVAKNAEDESLKRASGKSEARKSSGLLDAISVDNSVKKSISMVAGVAKQIRTIGVRDPVVNKE